MTTESDRKAAEEWDIVYEYGRAAGFQAGIEHERKRASERCLHGVLLGKSGECFECVPDIGKRASEGEADGWCLLYEDGSLNPSSFTTDTELIKPKLDVPVKIIKMDEVKND